jgi:hypothetical protein
MRVVGAAPMGGDFIESVIEAELPRKAMWRRSTNLLSLLLVIPAITL